MKKILSALLVLVCIILSSCGGSTSVPKDRIKNAYTNGWTNKETETVSASFSGLENQKYFKYYHLRVKSGNAVSYDGLPYKLYGQGNFSALNDLNFKTISGYNPKHNGSNVDYSFTTENGKAYQFAIWIYGSKSGLFGGRGDSGWIVSPSVMRVDLTTPNAPTITSNDRGSGEWKNDNSTTMSSTLDTSGEVSPRFNMYCLTNNGSCTYKKTKPNTSNLSNGEYSYKVKSCTTAGNCSSVKTFSLKIDTSIPGNTLIVGSEAWSNNPNVSLSFGSLGWGVGPSPSTRYYCIDDENSCIPNIAGNTYSSSSIPEGITYVRARTCDTGGCGPISSFSMKRDYTLPVIEDISFTPQPFAPLLATDSQQFRISVDANEGAPISLINGFFEDASTQNSFISPGFSSNSNMFLRNFSIRNVDDDGTPEDGEREYTLQVSNVCDQAGNCLGASHEITYPVYANTTGVISTILQNNIVSGIADGSKRDFKFSLEDAYGNNIIEAPSIGRTIDINILGNNHLRLDQYQNTGNDSAIFIGDKTTPFPIGDSQTLSFEEQISLNGEYETPFYIYSPTSHGNELVVGSGSISHISYDINATTNIVSGDTPKDQILLGSTELMYDPLFTTQIAGDVSVNGFIEGAKQSLNILVDTALGGRSIVGGSDSLILEFGEYKDGLNQEHEKYNLSLDGTQVTEGHMLDNQDLFRISGLVDYVGGTFLSQESTVNTVLKSYLATVIAYQIDGKDILYPGDIIGKPRYESHVSEYNANQGGIKILGQATSSKNSEITTDQFSNDVRIVGKLNKSTLKSEIAQKTIGMTKDIPVNNGTQSVVNLGGDAWSIVDGSGIGILKDTVLYFGDLNGEYIELGDNTSQLVADGRKTLVVIGGDLYITSNITYDSIDSILGIIVLSDDSGQGGNVYISPEVTDISAVVYANKSLLSAYDNNGNLIIEESEIHTIDTSIQVLKNQFYLYGSLFSENTIGGSRATPIECPYYVECNSLGEAQKYDLNYLRRYIQIDHDNDVTTPLINANSGKTSMRSLSLGVHLNSPVVIEYDSTIQLTPPPLFQ